MMSNYSALSILRNAFSGHRNWTRAWQDPEPKKNYDVVIIGAGGHGLATAYYLAKYQGVKNVAHIPGGFRAWKAVGGEVEPIV